VSKTLLSLLVVLLASAGCGSGEASEERTDRGSRAVAECREHGGVAGFDDDVVICADQTSGNERGMKAIEACRGRGGVSAFDDDIVICRDGTFHEAEGG
jgi:hypothetical protein